MPDRPATLRDVAAAARVHPATASRALNPETRILVSEDTARRVTEALALVKLAGLEDRRPGANADPYVVAASLIATVCGVETLLESAHEPANAA